MEIVFIAETPDFDSARIEYVSIWENEKENILETIKKIGNLSSFENKIKAIVYEGISHSGKDTTSPMKLRASYSQETKKATLIHELLHRFLFQLKERLGCKEHEILYLILYDIWTDLYGKKFADEQVAIESKRKGYLDYEAIWRNTLSLTRDERQRKWKELLKVNYKL